MPSRATYTPYNTLDHRQLPHPIHKLLRKLGRPAPDGRMEPLDRLVDLLPRVLSLSQVERSLEGGKLLRELGWGGDLQSSGVGLVVRFSRGGEGRVVDISGRPGEEDWARGLTGILSDSTAFGILASEYQLVVERRVERLGFVRRARRGRQTTTRSAAPAGQVEPERSARGAIQTAPLPKRPRGNLA